MIFIYTAFKSTKMQLTHAIPNWQTMVNLYRNTVNALYVKRVEIFARLTPHAWKGYPKIHGEITIPHTSSTLITGENAQTIIMLIVLRAWKKLTKNSVLFDYRHLGGTCNKIVRNRMLRESTDFSMCKVIVRHKLYDKTYSEIIDCKI